MDVSSATKPQMRWALSPDPVASAGFGSYALHRYYLG